MIWFVQTFCLAALTWTAPEPITNSVTNGNYSLAYNDATGQVFAAWADMDAGNIPVSSFFTPGANWSPEIDISNQAISVSPSRLMFPVVAYHKQLQRMFASWTPQLSGKPTYSIYNGSWSPQSGASTMFTNTLVNMAYNDGTNELFMLWGNGPVFNTIYNTSTSSWGPTVTVSASNEANAISGVYDPSANQFVAVWSTGSIMTNNLTYAVYSGGSWSSPQTIPGAVATSRPKLGLAYNEGTGNAYVAWNDATTGYPTYSFYDGTSWSAPAFINMVSQPIADVNLVYDPANMLLVAAWVDNTTKLPEYALLPDGSSTWSATEPFPGASVAGWNIQPAVPCGVALVYDSNLGKVFAGWADGTTGYPIWTFTGSPIPLFISDLSGRRFSDQFLLQKDLINLISWQVTFSTITGYEIYRDGQLIAVLDASATSYADHNQVNRSTTYTVVAKGPGGSRQSLSVVVN